DSYVLVTISGDATFTGVLNGRYVDAITGDVQQVTDGKLTATCKGKGNLRVYVLDTQKTPAPGKVGVDGKYLYASAPVEGSWTEWPDETMPEETWTEKPNGGGGTIVGGDRVEPDEPIAPSMAEGEQAVFFEHESWNPVSAWIWSSTANYTGSNWPGQSLTYLGNNVYKWTYTGTGKIADGSKVIFSRAGADQTSKDGWDFVNGGYYTVDGYQKTIEGAGEIPDEPIEPVEPSTYVAYFDNSASNWSSVYVWAWNGDISYNGGAAWPGTQLSLDPSTGYYRFSAEVEGGSPKIIFSNNGNSQTADLAWVNNGIYNASGYTGQQVTGIDNVTTSSIKV
ncbi:MAG: starch-binding protein, partial [Muribaculaceae bacterium]|nr:starch-binding protein [Muribaculaceae bacterium]